MTWQKEIPVYGFDRVAVRTSAFYDASFETIFELSDHLGSVRAAFKDDGSGSPQVLSYTDYYPYGWDDAWPEKVVWMNTGMVSKDSLQRKKKRPTGMLLNCECIMRG